MVVRAWVVDEGGPWMKSARLSRVQISELTNLFMWLDNSLDGFPSFLLLLPCSEVGKACVDIRFSPSILDPLNLGQHHDLRFPYSFPIFTHSFV